MGALDRRWVSRWLSGGGCDFCRGWGRSLLSYIDSCGGPAFLGRRRFCLIALRFAGEGLFFLSAIAVAITLFRKRARGRGRFLHRTGSLRWGGRRNYRLSSSRDRRTILHWRRRRNYRLGGGCNYRAARHRRRGRRSDWLGGSCNLLTALHRRSRRRNYRLSARRAIRSQGRRRRARARAWFRSGRQSRNRVRSRSYGAAGLALGRLRWVGSWAFTDGHG